ncbi:MAG TPA: PAS domain S-box protein, partial [Casimicrobiaceae bacterium]
MRRGGSGPKQPGAGSRAERTGSAPNVRKRRPGVALRESEARFRATFAQAAVGIAHVDARDGSFLRVNDKLCEILGYTRAELTRKTFKDISHPEDRALSDEPRARLLAGEIATFALDKRYLRKNGEPVWVRLTVSLGRRAGAKANYEIAVYEDITAQQRAETALRESEERFQYAVRGSQAGLWDWNVATDHYYLSPRSKAILGYGEHELPDERAQLLAHVLPEDRDRLEDAVKQHLERREPFDIEYRMRRKDGRTIWCHDV